MVKSPSRINSSNAMPSMLNGHAVVQSPAFGSWLRFTTAQAGTPPSPVISP
jgi:hypothetical protein